MTPITPVAAIELLRTRMQRISNIAGPCANKEIANRVIAELRRFADHTLVETCKIEAATSPVSQEAPAAPESELTDEQKRTVGCMDAWARDAALPTYSHLYKLPEQYSDMLRKICFEYGAGGYNSEGLMTPSVAESKIRWVIDDVQRWPKIGIAPPASTESAPSYTYEFRNKPDGKWWPLWVMSDAEADDFKEDFEGVEWRRAAIAARATEPGEQQ